MTKTGQNFTMWSGNHVDLTITVYDSTGASKDLSGACGTWALSSTPLSASLVRKTSDAASDIVLSGSSMTVYIVPAETSTLQGAFHHEAQIRDSACKLVTVATGVVYINPKMIGD